MKVLSILQPWATLVAMGYKKIETRGWNTRHRGPLLIHASKSRSMGMDPQHHNRFLHTVYNKYAPDAPPFVDLPFGAIIGQVRVAGAIETYYCTPGRKFECEGNMMEITEAELAMGEYTRGRWGWTLCEPVQFKLPTLAKGSLNLWDFDENFLNTKNH